MTKSVKFNSTFKEFEKKKSLNSNGFRKVYDFERIKKGSADCKKV